LGKNRLRPLGVAQLILGVAFGLISSKAMGMSVDEKLEIAKSRCAPPESTEPVLYSNIFRGSFDKSQMKELYEIVYKSPKRLPNRVGYENSGLFISRSLNNFTNFTEFNENVLKAIIKQVEATLRHDHARYIFFPDMGHSHFFIPLDYYESEMKGRPLGIYLARTVAMRSSGLKMLYHTAEKLIMTDEDRQVLNDMDTQWRFHTRNPSLDLNGNIMLLKKYSGSGVNTARNLDGYRYYAGFSISANQKGCFPFETATGEIQYFDLSAFSLAPQPGTGDIFFTLPHSIFD